jgi:hypothetical protein
MADDVIYVSAGNKLARLLQRRACTIIAFSITRIQQIMLETSTG